jgi:hypothetical protein
MAVCHFSNFEHTAKNREAADARSVPAITSDDRAPREFVRSSSGQLDPGDFPEAVVANSVLRRSIGQCDGGNSGVVKRLAAYDLRDLPYNSP